MKKYQNIVLIGMPGAGKSTVGVVLAKRLGCRFVDSDLVMQEKFDRLLWELIEEHGVEGFWELENQVNRSMDIKNSVIATGGSAVYGKEAMERFRDSAKVVYLQLPYEEIEKRLGDLTARGVTLRPGQTLKELYEERKPLYEKYAHIILDCSGKQIREIVTELAGRI